MNYERYPWLRCVATISDDSTAGSTTPQTSAEHAHLRDEAITKVQRLAAATRGHSVMGMFAFHSGINRNLYRMIYKWLGHLPGGMAMATVGGCAGFAAISGSSVANAATMGTLTLPEMKRYGYRANMNIFHL